MKPTVKHSRMLRVLARFRVVFKSVRVHYQSVERRTGVSGAQIWALSRVAEQPGLRVGQLAAALAIHQSTASNLVHRLEAHGFIRRRRHGRDQRNVELFPTPHGRRALAHAPRPLIGVLQQALSDLPASSLTALERDLGKVVAAMKRKALQAARQLPLSDI